MKNKFLPLLIIAILLLSLCLGGCSNGYEWEQNSFVQNPDTSYKDYYHIFVYSFADGNGDGIGDLKGIESKLDYIANLGYNGIFLSPISPSPTYHKYDVTNYQDVDSQFGTLEDFDSLVSAAHQKGISVMLDMVFNHSSNNHPWFTQARQAVRNKTESKYINYYNFSDDTGNSYATFGGYTHMPKLNLSNDDVKEEIASICKFWVDDHDVDAFRLDAAYHYYSNATQNIAFMQWLMETARQYNPNFYMVGEVWQTENTVYSHYADNSVQSFFNFNLSNASGYNALFPIINGMQDIKASTLQTLIERKEQGTAKGIDALFTSNHDTSRISNIALPYFSNRDQVVREDLLRQHKMGIATLYTMSGNVFNYYGNEIGLRNGQRTIIGSDYLDQTYRIAMNWDSGNVENHQDGFTYQAYGAATRFGQYEDLLGGVAQQIDDQNSLYNHNRRIMLLRRQNPEIAAGTSQFASSGFADVAIVLRTYNQKTVMLVYNINPEETRSIDIADLYSTYGLEGVLAGFVTADYSEKVKLTKQLTMPPYSVAVVR